MQWEKEQFIRALNVLFVNIVNEIILIDPFSYILSNLLIRLNFYFLFPFSIHLVVIFTMNSYQKCSVIVLSNINNIYYHIYLIRAFILIIFVHL